MEWEIESYWNKENVKFKVDCKWLNKRKVMVDNCRIGIEILKFRIIKWSMMDGNYNKWWNIRLNILIKIMSSGYDNYGW